jgi:hypothetical protein
MLKRFFIAILLPLFLSALAFANIKTEKPKVDSEPDYGVLLSADFDDVDELLEFVNESQYIDVVAISTFFKRYKEVNRLFYIWLDQDEEYPPEYPVSKKANK